MAIYKNREVTILDFGHQRNLQDTITVESSSAGTETVPVAAVRFTKDEIKKLNEHKEIGYENLLEASDEDLKAVRLGVAPAYNQDRIEKAKSDINAEEAKKMDQKLVDDAKAQAIKTQKAEVKSFPKTQSQTTPWKG